MFSHQLFALMLTQMLFKSGPEGYKCVTSDAVLES